MAHYDQQSEDEAVAEDEAAFEDERQAVVKVPRDLFPAVRDLITKYTQDRKASA